MSGKRLNTDAVDNSAGVDTSDHEVNIKILINEAIAAGDLTMKQRDKLLAEMTEEVGRWSCATTTCKARRCRSRKRRAYTLLDQQGRFMRGLGTRQPPGPRHRIPAGRRDHARRASPSASASPGRKAPSCSLIAKMALYDELLPSDLPDDPQLADDLISYFPEQLREGYQAASSTSIACAARSFRPW